jgi:hypothetical protein
VEKYPHPLLSRSFVFIGIAGKSRQIFGFEELSSESMGKRDRVNGTPKPNLERAKGAPWSALYFNGSKLEEVDVASEPQLY